MSLIVGMTATSDGQTVHDEVTASRIVDPSGARLVAEKRSIYSVVPSGNYLTQQPSHIGVNVEHRGGEVGEMIYAVRSQRGLFAVLRVDDDALADLPERFYLSSEFESKAGPGGQRVDIELHAIGLVSRSATVGKQAAVIVHGDLDDAYAHRANPHRRMLEEARTYDRERRCRGDRRHRIAGLAYHPLADLEVGDDAAFLHGQIVPERRHANPMSDDAQRFGVRAVEFHRGGRILAVR